MVPRDSKIQSIISFSGYQAIRNHSEPSELNMMHLDIYAEYLRHAEPPSESREVRALLTTGGTRHNESSRAISSDARGLNK